MKFTDMPGAGVNIGFCEVLSIGKTTSLTDLMVHDPGTNPRNAAFLVALPFPPNPGGLLRGRDILVAGFGRQLYCSF